jgi:hypothetical protein
MVIPYKERAAVIMSHQSTNNDGQICVCKVSRYTLVIEQGEKDSYSLKYIFNGGCLHGVKPNRLDRDMM